MRKETTNKIRFVIEDIFPAILRDSFLFRWAAKTFWNDNVIRLAEFRKNIVFVTDEEYAKLYDEVPDIHDHGDNTEASNTELISNIMGESVCDVGCGGGSLLLEIQKRRPDIQRLVGVDFAVNEANKFAGIEFFASKIETLPFKDGEFDTVVCTHVVEHILEYRKAIVELRRITKKRLIVVVPREREYYYTFNAHLNFFPYPHSLLRAMYPVPENYRCFDIQRDLYYQEDHD